MDTTELAAARRELRDNLITLEDFERIVEDLENDVWRDEE